MQRDLSTRHLARIELIHKVVSASDGLERAFLSTMRLSARTLKIARVGIWYFHDEKRCVECRYLYDSSLDRALEGEIIELSSCPRYAAALQTYRIIMANDALRDPRTSELEDYLLKHGISSLMDSPIFQQGEPVGVVCHEHVGVARSWSKEEANFAATVSDMLGLYLEQDAARRYYTALLEAQRELERARVMESLGRMAAAVAHDFNNLLSALSMSTELLRLKPNPTHDYIERTVEENQTLIEQGARLVRQLLDLGHQQPSAEVVDLVATVRGMSAFWHTLELDGISVDVRCLSERAAVRLSRTRAEQVLMNLAVNARDAMLGGGKLAIEVDCSEAGGDRRVSLRVVDTGVGMDERTRERIFEPYFTTKDQGQGHGLGLPTVYRIVQDSQGRIEVKSALGAGSEFQIEWPAA